MSQIDKTEIRPLYSEFQGYLSQAPNLERVTEAIDDESVWNQFNDAVDLLSGVTEKEYHRFKIIPLSDTNFSSESGRTYTFIRVATYKQKLGGLISHLYGEYFSDEPAPFSGMPSTIITQSQNQSTHVQMLFDINTTIVRALDKPDISEKQKGFLNKLKSGLDSISNANDLVKRILSLGKEFGLTFAQILSLFGG